MLKANYVQIHKATEYCWVFSP